MAQHGRPQTFRAKVTDDDYRLRKAQRSAARSSVRVGQWTLTERGGRLVAIHRPTGRVQTVAVPPDVDSRRAEED